MKVNNFINASVAFLMLVLSGAVMADPSEWSAFQASGENAIENKNYDDADKLFQRALSIAKANFKKSKKHAKTLYFIGKLKMLQKNSVKAIGFYEKALKIRKRQFGKNHDKTLAVMEDLAQARIESGKPHYAEPLYKKIIKAKSKDLGEKHPDVIALMGKLASLMLVLDKPKESLPLFKVVTETGKKTKMNPLLLARFYDEYGRALRQSGKVKEAEAAETNGMQLRSDGKEKSEFVQVSPAKSGASNASSNATTGAAPVAKKEYEEPAGLKVFRKLMVNDKGYSVSEEYGHTLCKDSRTSKNLAHCIVYWFKAPNKNVDNVYPRLTVRLYQYQDNKGAIAAQQSLRKAASPDTGLNYEWNNITVNGNWMYWVSAACTYSTGDWAKLVASFKAKMNAAEQKALVCRCGGACAG